MLRRIVLLAIVGLLLIAIAQPAAAQRGKVHQFESDFTDSETFLQPLKMIGRSGGMSVYWVFDASECFFEDNSPVPNCHVMAPQPGTASATDVDPGQMVIPAKTVSDGLLFFVRQNSQIYLENDAPGDNQGRFVFRPMLTISSDAFLDPRCVDPTTNLPCNGQLTFNLLARRVNRLMHSGEWFEDTVVDSRPFFLTRNFLTQGYGLPADLADKFFNGQIKVQMSIYTVCNMGGEPYADAYFIVMGH